MPLLNNATLFLGFSHPLGQGSASSTVDTISHAAYSRFMLTLEHFLLLGYYSKSSVGS